MIGLAGFDFEALNRKYLASPSNDAADYGVSIVRARSLNAYRCIGAYHLTKAENAGRHNVFVEVLDEQGRRDRTPMLNWTESLDRPIQSKHLDKPANEPAADIPLNGEATVTLRINDGKPGGDSDSVGGLHFRHINANGEYGHHSFHIVFQRQSAIAPPVDPPTPVEPLTLTLESLAARVTALEKQVGDWTGGE